MEPHKTRITIKYFDSQRLRKQIHLHIDPDLTLEKIKDLVEANLGTLVNVHELYNPLIENSTLRDESLYGDLGPNVELKTAGQIHIRDGTTFHVQLLQSEPRARRDLPSPPEMLHIKVRNVGTGRFVDVEFVAEHTIRIVKEYLEPILGFTVDSQRLIYKGRQMEDSMMLCDYGVADGDRIDMVMRLRGS